MSLPLTLSLIFGLIILTAGAEILVRSASKLAAAFGISPLVIGLTVVAFGTSAPELAVSVRSAILGQSDVALGNVVGSNIFNILFILGICALIVPLKVNSQLIRTDVPVMIATSILCLLISLDQVIGRFDGLILVLLLIGYTWFSIKQGKAAHRSTQQEFSHELGQSKPKKNSSLAAQVVFIVVGLGLLIWGAEMFVEAAVEVARSFGISELVIGLTIVAVGTSLPEVATSIVASIRGERDIAIGNVVGSNIFNVLSVLGISSVLHPISISPAALSFDIPVMVIVALACLPVFFTDLSIKRWEGGLFLAYYIAYSGFLIMQASDYAGKAIYSEVMLWYIIPLTAITLVVLSAHQWRKKKSSS